MSVLALLEERVSPEPNSGCWLWDGWCDTQGYGRFVVGGKVRRAHRASWEEHHGPIPAGLVICHKCDVRACINPAHLFLGTVADNNADAFRKGRRVSPTGERHGSSKLTAAQALAIYLDARTLVVIAREFGIRAQSVLDIKQGKNWRTVTRHKPGSYPARNGSKPNEGSCLPHAQQHEVSDVRQAEQVYPKPGEVCRERG